MKKTYSSWPIVIIALLILGAAVSWPYKIELTRVIARAQSPTEERAVAQASPEPIRPALPALGKKLYALVSKKFQYGKAKYFFGGTKTFSRLSPFGEKVTLSGAVTSFYIQDLESGEELGLAADDKNMAASLIKIPIMAAVYYYWKNKLLDLDPQDEVIINSFVLIMKKSSNPDADKIIQILGKAYLAKYSGNVDFKSLNAVERKALLEEACLKKSSSSRAFEMDNYACLDNMIAQYQPVIKASQITDPNIAYFLYGLEAVNDFLDRVPGYQGRIREWIWVAQYKNDPRDGQTYLNLVSTRDLGLLLAGIYRDEYFPKDASREFLNTIMAKHYRSVEKKPLARYKLSKSVPESIEIATKTGYVNGSDGAMALIFLANRPYVIVVIIKSDHGNHKAAQEFITAIGAVTFNYFANLADSTVISPVAIVSR